MLLNCTYISIKKHAIRLECIKLKIVKQNLSIAKMSDLLTRIIIFVSYGVKTGIIFHDGGILRN